MVSQQYERDCSPELDNLIGYTFPLLDEGFIRVIDYMGNDEAIVKAARRSYGKGTSSRSENASLIEYLMSSRHTSPFEMCQLKIHVKMPIFVARQWIRHRMASLNELSGRYSEMPEEQFEPPTERLVKQSKTNKQGSSIEPISDHNMKEVLAAIEYAHDTANSSYQFMLSQGVTREIARGVLPLNTYTEMYWTADLHNLLHLLKLRCDGHAQREIQVYAEQLEKIVKVWVPDTHEAWENHVYKALSLSGNALEAFEALLRTHEISEENIANALKAYGVRKREADKILAALDRTGRGSDS